MSSSSSALNSPDLIELPSGLSSTSIISVFRGKNVFLTGGTGFVGKVIIEKILRSCPDIRCLYVLVRPRKGSTAQERMKAEICSSEIFARLKSELGPERFAERLNSKLKAIGGELTQSEIGLSEADKKFFLANINIIIHSAAIVDFNERLDRAVELNVNGSLRLLELAKQCAHIDAFIHVSTCYVNSNRRGWIDEKVYNLGFDPEEMLNRISQLKETELEQITGSGILQDWPNTYTFTKAITEALIMKRREGVPVAVVRPSIIGSSLREPVPGWVDVITAAGAVYMSVGLGVLKFLPGSDQTIADIIPVDYVVNAILAAVPAVYRQDRFLVCHASSSTENPMRWGHPGSIMVPYFNSHPPARRVAPADFRLIPSPQMYQIQFFLQYSIPSTILNTLSLVGIKSYQLKAAQFNKLIFRVRVLIESFRHFVENEWQFNNRNARTIGQWLNEDERKMFPLELSDIDWPKYNEEFAHGLMRYVLKADINEIYEEQDATGQALTRLYRDLNKDPWKPKGSEQVAELSALFPDLSWARQQLANRPQFGKFRSPNDMIQLVLQHPMVAEAIKAEANAALRNAKSQSNSANTVESRARAICEKMFGDNSMPVVGGMGLMLRKIWRKIYSTIRVEASGLTKAMEAAKRGPIVFIPTHRSYVDFLIISYICFCTGLPMPFIAAGEDFLGIYLVRHLFRHSGAFFIRRSLEGDPLYTAILTVYVQQLMKDGQSIEFFIEGTRSRSGKMLHPKTGMLSFMTDAFLNGEVKNCSVIPIAINYEKIIEGDLYSDELLGNSKIKESLKSLLKSLSVLSVNFGAISVKFGDPIDLREYTAMHMQATPAVPIERFSPLPAIDLQKFAQKTPKTLIGTAAEKVQQDAEKPIQPSGGRYDPVQNRSDRRYYNHQLAYKIVYDLTCGNEVMPTHIVATLLLMYRQGVTRPQLVAKVDWVRRELTARGAKTFGLCGEDRSLLVDAALRHLSSVVVQRRSNVYEPAISARHEYKNMLVLGHYRNKLLHYFFLEGLWAIALYSFGERMETGVPINELLEEVKFLYSLLYREFIYKPNPDQPDDLMAVLNTLIGRGIFSQAGPNKDLVEVSASGESHFSFLCALFWPFVDSYYSAAMILFSLQPSRQVEESVLLQRTQWLATTLYHESMLSFYESCSLDTLRNALATLKLWGVVKIERVRVGGSGLSGNGVTASLSSQPVAVKSMVSLLEPFTQEAPLQSIVDRISRLRKQPPVRKNVARKNLIAEIPILAKL